MLKNNDYHPDLYDDDKKWNNPKMEQELKEEFLQKIIDVVCEDKPALKEVGISTGKITAGEECDKTRKFLQYLCLAALEDKAPEAK